MVAPRIFTNAYLRHVSLRHVCLRHACLRQHVFAPHNRIKSFYESLRHAALGHVSLRHAFLRHIFLGYAFFWHAFLRHASLRYVCLRHAYLVHSSLRSANLRSASLRHKSLCHKSLRHIKVSNNKQQPKLSVCAVDTPNSTAVQSSTFYNWFIRCKGIKVYVILTIPSEFWRYIISLLSYLCIDVECMMDSPVMTTSKKCGYRRKPFLLLLFLSLASLLFSATQWLKINQNWLSSAHGERSELAYGSYSKIKK